MVQRTEVVFYGGDVLQTDPVTSFHLRFSWVWRDLLFDVTSSENDSEFNW
jgi:hypothetical protein